MVRRTIWAIFAAMLIVCRASFAQDAKPAQGDGTQLRDQARQPHFYEVEFDKEIDVFVRSMGTNIDGETSPVIEVRKLVLHFDEQENHLTAKAAVVTVAAMDCVRSLHIGVFDEYKKLLGTASVQERIEPFYSLGCPTAVEGELVLDFGMAPSYARVKYVQLVVTGRKKSDTVYDHEDIPKLVQRLKGKSDPEGQMEAAQALARFGPSAVPGLIEVLNSDEGAVGLAASVLGKIGSEEAVSPLARILNDPAKLSNVRVSAALALGRIGKSGVDELLKALNETHETRVTVAIVHALGWSGSKKAAEDLAKHLMDDDRFYGFPKVTIIRSLRQLGYPCAIPALIHALSDTEKPVRQEAALTLEQIAKHTVPVQWEDVSDTAAAWAGAPLPAREAAIKKWNEWWQHNKGKFGL